MSRHSTSGSVALACALLLAAAAPSHAQRQTQEIDTLALRAHSYFLAHDLLEGRGTGSRGEHAAALYLRSQLIRLGLEGAGDDGGFLQRLPLVRSFVDTSSTSLRVGEGAARRSFATPADFLLNTGGRGAFRDFQGPLRHLGSPEDALRALGPAADLEGRVVVVEGPLGVAALRLVPEWRRRGVRGVILLIPDEDRYALFTRSRGGARYYVDATVDDPIWQPALPVLLAGPALSAALLEGGGEEVERRRVEARIVVETEPVEAANVLGLLPGNDPELREEVVVYTAHFDHLGLGPPDERGDSIYNGFSDNAAGVSMLLAIAERLAADPPARSVLFAFFTGEERGLLGSSYFAAHPPLPLERMVAAINLDAGAPPAPPVTWEAAGGTVSTLGELASAVAEERGWRVRSTHPRPNSDYWPLLARGVPAVFLIPGGEWEGVGEAEQEELRRRWDHYHQASDHWSASFPFSGLARYAELALAIGRAAASKEEERPRLLAPTAP